MIRGGEDRRGEDDIKRPEEMINGWMVDGVFGNKKEGREAKSRNRTKIKMKIEIEIDE